MGAYSCVIAGFSDSGKIHRNSRIPTDFMELADSSGFDARDRMCRGIESPQMHTIDATVAPDQNELQIGARVRNLPSLVIALRQFQVAFANSRLLFATLSF